MMRRNIFSIVLLGCLLASMLFGASSVFADSPYGIVYSGGEPLGENNNVQVDPDLINGLKVLVSGGDVDIDFSNNAAIWRDGYVRVGLAARDCRPVKYIAIYHENQISRGDGIYYTVSNDDYMFKVKLNNVALENADAFNLTDKFLSVAIINDKSKEAGYLYVGQRIYSDGDCSVQEPKSIILSDDTAFKMFVEVNIGLYRSDNLQNPYVANGIYFGLLDIDAKQSYKILSERDKLTPANMYVRSDADLQPSPGSNAKNMYVPEGSYIYSQGYYDITTDKADIFVPISKETQAVGLDVVFGFVGYAWGGISLYAKQYVVIYQSDGNSIVSGIQDDGVCQSPYGYSGFGRQVISGANPGEAFNAPCEGYRLKYWTADVDVELTDGTVILAGTPMTMAQIVKVVVEQDITFTAFNETIPINPDPDDPDDPDTPDTGDNTNIGSGSNDLSGLLAFCQVSGVVVLAGVGFVGRYAFRSEKKDVRMTFELQAAGRAGNGNYTDDIRLARILPKDAPSTAPQSRNMPRSN
ncbi:hypothetical protein IKZ77_01235 [Candidatus Saccharibacteria bacterium]|nr:hypothetical protein [Candidatus Saccharibacteria bacterium]